MFSKILIANRGEIALRVIRACRTLGIRTVAVFSEADRTAPHVRYADEAYAIGPAEPSASYLNIERILGAARTAKADAIHPGYGFLSENAAFAEACVRAGIVFVGPPPSVLRSVGDKDEARRTMAAAGVPVIPGSDRALADADEARRIAATLGYPVALKAASGGGGRGIRRVADAGALAEAFGRAAREAQQAFGDGRLYLEKLVESARHVEVQVLGDAHGNLRALGERACSVQRRNQKLL
ncbi:MAG: hypothetical protein HY608_09130, partial [Planctomycetes bacterium]|nr:hypothetical protein [Planctomycetota bacterium]